MIEIRRLQSASRHPEQNRANPCSPETRSPLAKGLDMDKESLLRRFVLQGLPIFKCTLLHLPDRPNPGLRVLNSESRATAHDVSANGLRRCCVSSAANKSFSSCGVRFYWICHWPRTSARQFDVGPVSSLRPQLRVLRP